MNYSTCKGLQGLLAIWQDPRMWWTLQCVQYDGCSLQSYSSYPSALCGARTQTHSSTHIVLHTHSYKHLYTVSQWQYNTYQHKHTETQTRAKTHVHRQRHRERHMETNWLSHKLNCLQFVQPAQLTYFAFHKFGLCYSQAEFVLLTSWVCATHKLSLCYSQAYLVPQEA